MGINDEIQKMDNIIRQLVIDKFLDIDIYSYLRYWHIKGLDFVYKFFLKREKNEAVGGVGKKSV